MAAWVWVAKGVTVAALAAEAIALFSALVANPDADVALPDAAVAKPDAELALPAARPACVLAVVALPDANPACVLAVDALAAAAASLALTSVATAFACVVHVGSCPTKVSAAALKVAGVLDREGGTSTSVIWVVIYVSPSSDSVRTEKSKYWMAMSKSL